ncbi:MAG TPA: S8 family serine peptidase [Steroidobacteraceae bacterium]
MTMRPKPPTVIAQLLAATSGLARFILFVPLLGQVAQAQLLPHGVQLPQVQLPGNLEQLGTAPLATLDPVVVQQAYQRRIKELLRRYPKVIERDPQGAPMVRGELLAYAPDAAVMGRAIAQGFVPLRQLRLDGLDVSLIILQAPAGASTAQALVRLRSVDPTGLYEFNHLYIDSGETGGNAPSPASPPAEALRSPASPNHVTVGLIDGGIDSNHPVFHQVMIHRFGCNGKVLPTAHGTAVASLLVGRSTTFQGAAPNAELFAADVYCAAPTGGAVDSVAQALAWMTQQDVPVINISLVGPYNAILAQVVRAVTARGGIIVAAVGNEGPAAQPLYPASYAEVLAVTAVDGRGRLLLEAGRCTHIDFAAPGADIRAAAPGTAYTAVRGTSFAAPIVAGFAATFRHEAPRPDPVSWVRAKLAAEAVQPKHPDPRLGGGILGQDLEIKLNSSADAR